MGLLIRMVLYAVSAGLAGTGVAVYDPDAATLTFDIEHLASVFVGLVGFVGTFIASRIAKARGGTT